MQNRETDRKLRVKGIYRIIIAAAVILAAMFALYKWLPYYFVVKPVLMEIVPNQVLMGTPFSSDNVFTVKGQGLDHATCVFVNGVYDSECKVISSSAEEIKLQLPGRYLSSPQEMRIQFEVRKNSDMALLSSQIWLTVYGDSGLPVPKIERIEPSVLRYDGSLNQTITLYGQNLNGDCRITVDGTQYTTTYDEATGGQTLILPYEKWSGKASLVIAARRLYNGYPTNVWSGDVALETSSASPASAAQAPAWAEYRTISQTVPTDELFQEKYDLGQRVFQADMDTTKLDDLARLCTLLQQHEDMYLYLRLPSDLKLVSFHGLLSRIASTVNERYAAVAGRIIIPVQDVISYHLLMEIWPEVQYVYAPKADSVSAQALQDMYDASGFTAVFLPAVSTDADVVSWCNRNQCALYAPAPQVTGDGRVETDWTRIDYATNSAAIVEYLNSLKNDRYAVFMAVKDDVSVSITPEIQAALQGLGLTQNLQDGYRYAYMAVLDGGKNVHEAFSPDHIKWDGDVAGLPVHLESAGWASDNISIIRLNRQDFSLNRRGLNIVVYDKELSQVIDSVCIDLSQGLVMNR